MKRAVGACPNARFMSAVTDCCLFTALTVFSRQLERALIHNSADGCYQEELGGVWKESSNLEEVAFFMECKIADIHAFFVHPKPTLRKAELFIDDDDIVEIMNSFTHRTGGSNTLN